MPTRRLALRAAAAFVAMTLAAPLLAAPASAQDRPITVFAAASLKNALDEIGAAYAAAGGAPVVVSYAASSALAKQIESGAPADIFISADLAWMDYLGERKLIRAETRGNLLGNRLVLVAATGSAAPVEIGPGLDLAGLVGDGRIAMGEVSSVPAGKYGKAALESLDLWAAVEPKVAGAESVRAALLLVSRGEAPYGIVYRTDAAADPAVEIVGTFPEDSHPPIIYPAALTAEAHPAAAEFLAFLRSPKAVPAFETQGFSVLD